VLWRELGVEPGPELDRLWRQAGAQTAGTPAATPATVVAAPLGRTQIVTGLVDELQGAENGSGSSALVVGDPGIGKTAVVRAVADHFRGRGWRVATAVGGSAPAGSYTTLADALGRLAEGTPHEPFVRGLVSAGPGSLQPVRPETAERALHQRILDILQEAADLPTLLVVDDLHAADPATVRLVHDLAGAPATRSWSLLAAARPFPAVVWVGPEQLLGPLPDRLIESLVRERCGEQSDATVQRVVARAAGNPLFARELAALLSAGADDSEVPGSALQLVRNRLARLPGTQRVLIPLVVLAGAQATWPVVSRAAAELGLDPGDHRTDASAWLGSDDLIGDCDGRLAARHPLVAEAALALLRRSDRARLHDVLAAVVEREAGERVADRHRIAAFEAAPTPVRAGLALPAACREAQLALRQGADEEAAGLARCALRAWSAGSPAERTQRLSDALDAHLTLGHALAITRPAEAEAAYEAGLRNAGCDDERARFGIARGWLAYVHGEYSRAAHCYQEARELPGLSPAVRAAVSVHQGWVFARVNLLERALELCEEAQAVINPEESPHTAALVNDRSGMILVWLGRLEEARVTLERAFEQVARVDDPGLLAGIQIHRADLASRCRDFETSLRLLDDALAVTRGAGDTYVEAVTWWIRTDVMVRMGDRSGAEAASREEERILRLLNNPSHLAACLRRRQGFAADSAGRTR
jgi:tetratricopeptide (TPR) repeat protein